MRVRLTANYVLKRLIFLLQSTNTLPMARSMGLPLFQDNSTVGRILGFVIRGGWVWLGGMVTLVFVLPPLLLLVIKVILPPVIILQIVGGLVTIIFG